MARFPNSLRFITHWEWFSPAFPGRINNIKLGACGIPKLLQAQSAEDKNQMIRATQRLNTLLYKQHVDYVEYVLLLLVLVFGAVATGQALTHQIGSEFNHITNGF
jgi:hypothetical protein